MRRPSVIDVRQRRVSRLMGVSLRGGALPDICYHATVLPVLVFTLVLILRARPVTFRRAQSSGM